HRLLRIEDPVRHRTAWNRIEKAGEALRIGPEDEKLFAIPMIDHLVLLQDGFCHLRIRNPDESIELGMCLVTAWTASHHDAAGADIETNRADFSAFDVCFGHGRHCLILFHYSSISAFSTKCY